MPASCLEIRLQVIGYKHTHIAESAVESLESHGKSLNLRVMEILAYRRYGAREIQRTKIRLIEAVYMG